MNNNPNLKWNSGQIIGCPSVFKEVKFKLKFEQVVVKKINFSTYSVPVVFIRLTNEDDDGAYEN